MCSVNFMFAQNYQVTFLVSADNSTELKKMKLITQVMIFKLFLTYFILV